MSENHYSWPPTSINFGGRFALKGHKHRLKLTKTERNKHDGRKFWTFDCVASGCSVPITYVLVDVGYWVPRLLGDPNPPSMADVDAAYSMAEGRRTIKKGFYG